MVEFKSAGHVAEVYGWKIEVVPGKTAYLNVRDGSFGARFTAEELREISAMFIGAADLMQGFGPGPLTAEELEALPADARVFDKDDDVWIKQEDSGMWHWTSPGGGLTSTSDRLAGSYGPIRSAS